MIYAYDLLHCKCVGATYVLRDYHEGNLMAFLADVNLLLVLLHRNM